MNFTNTVEHRDFKAGDPVVILYQGLYNGSRGRYIALREDPLWVDVEESDGSRGSHPLLWLRHPDEVVGPANSAGARGESE